MLRHIFTALGCSGWSEVSGIAFHRVHRLQSRVQNLLNRLSTKAQIHRDSLLSQRGTIPHLATIMSRKSSAAVAVPLEN